MFFVLMVGRNCEPYAQTALDSVAAQTGEEFRVCIVDDASTDGTSLIVERECERHGWTYILRNEPVGAMQNQFEAWNCAGLNDDDIVIWVDMDDRLAHPGVLSRVREEYDRGALVTYGSYAPEPPSATCPAVLPYPDRVVKDGSHRAYMRARGGIHFNHLRSCSWRVLREVTEADCKDSHGDWWQVAPDFATMLPALEVARDRTHVISDVLYLYRSDRAAAEWRLYPDTVRRAHQEMIDRPPKRPVSQSAVRVAKFEAQRRRRT